MSHRGGYLKKVCLASLVLALVLPLFWISHSSKNPNTEGSTEAVAAASIKVAAPNLTQVSTSTPDCCHAAAQSAPVSESIPETVELNAWAQKYAAANALEKAALEADGIEIAGRREAALAKVIESDPKKALDSTIPYSIRTTLPASVASHLEQRVSARGEYQVSVTAPLERTAPKVTREAVLNGKRYAAFVYGKRVGQISGSNVLMHGIAVGDKLAVHEQPVRELEVGESPDPQAPVGNPDKRCPVSGNLASRAVDAGGTIWYVCSHGHIEALGDQLSSAAAAESVAGAPSINKTGPNTLLYIRVDFSDYPGEPITVANAQNAMNVVNNFYIENSYNKTSMTTTVTSSVYRLPQTGANYANNFAGLINDAITAANANYATANYNLIVVACAYLGNGAAGQGYVGARGCALYGYFDLRVTAHELGHNYGVWHANYWTADPSNGSSGGNEEYGDSYDTMGFGDSSGNLHFNAQFKYAFGWLASSQVKSVTTSGTYRLYAFDKTALGSNFGALSIAKPGDASARVYWADFRQKITGNPWLMNGVDLHWAPWGSSNGGTHLLDTTFGSGAGKSDAAVTIGRTYSDTVSGVHITPIGKGGTTPESLDVVVNIGSFAGNSPPTETVNATPSTVGTGVPTTLTASASDPNGDALAYFWDFGDGSFGAVSSPTVSKSWPSLGSYTVTCTVSDMKGGKANASFVVTVSNGNVAPVAQDQSIGVPTNTAKSITLVATDINNDPLTYTVLTNPAHGTLSGSGATRTYTPAANYTGADSFTFKANDSKLDSNTATVSITVANLASVNYVTTNTTTQGSWKAAYGSDGYVVIGDSQSLPAYASVTPAGKSDYVWAASTTDVRGAQKAASATDRIAACWYSGGAFTVDVNMTDNQVHRLAMYCMDWDSYGPRSERIEVLDGATDTVLDSRDMAAFTNGKYIVWDIKGFVRFRITNLNTNAVINGLFFGERTNTAPVASDQSVTTNEDTAKAITLAATDADGNSLTYSVVGGPAHGTLSGTAPNLTYTPAANYNGADSFTFKANDGVADSNVATVSIGITAVNDAPVAAVSASPTTGMAPLATSFDGSASSDVDGTIASYDWNFGDGSTGSGAISNHTYTNPGTYTATLTVTDNSGATASKTVTITATTNQSVHVASIVMSVTVAKGGTKANAKVTIVDANNVVRSGATVTGTWSGVISGSASGTTASNGSVTLSSAKTKRAGTFTFTVTGVTLAGYTYNSAQNVITSNSIGSSGAPADAAASAGAIDLGTVTAGQKINIPLAIPEELAGVARVRTAANDKSALPPGVAAGRGALVGKPRAAGTYSFEIRFSGKVPGTDGDAFETLEIVQMYRLTVAP